eukprot:maker-scaffold785_size97262-snap-gene-0.13 protein:Tk00299 transcript:maker-scaffold785_size97262-snap-gene-0.13-mRNA-1 annotation:"multispecies: glutaminase"
MEAKRRRVLDLLSAGMTVKEVLDIVSCSRSLVDKVKKLRKDGKSLTRSKGRRGRNKKLNDELLMGVACEIEAIFRRPACGRWPPSPDCSPLDYGILTKYPPSKGFFRHLQAQQEGNRNQSMKIPEQSSLGSGIRTGETGLTLGSAKMQRKLVFLNLVVKSGEIRIKVMSDLHGLDVHRPGRVRVNSWPDDGGHGVAQFSTQEPLAQLAGISTAGEMLSQPCDLVRALSSGLCEGDAILLQREVGVIGHAKQL